MSAWILDVTTGVMALALLIATFFLARLIVRVEKTAAALEEMARTLTEEATTTLQNVNVAAGELGRLGTDARTTLGRLEKVVRGAEATFNALGLLTSLANKQTGSLVRLAGVLAGVNRGISTWRKARLIKSTTRGKKG